MVDANTSFFRLLKTEVPFVGDLVITNANFIIDTKFNLRRLVQTNQTNQPHDRQYDVFIGSSNDSGSSIPVGVNILTVESFNFGSDQIFTGLFTPLREFKIDFQAIPLENRNGKIVYDIILSTFGAVVGPGPLTLLIRTFPQDYTADEINTLIATISAVNSFFAYDIVERQIGNSADIVYDLFALYIPS